MNPIISKTLAATFTIMVKAEYVKQVKALFTAIAAIQEEVRLYLAPEGISFKELCPSHIGLIYGLIAKDDCQIFTLDKATEIGVNLKDLNAILKKDKENCILELRGTAGEHCLHIQTDAVVINELELIDIDKEVINIESLVKAETDCKFTITYPQLQKAVRYADLYSEVVDIITSEKGVEFASDGTMGAVKVSYPKELLTTYTSFAKTKGAFAIQYLKMILLSQKCGAPKPKSKAAKLLYKEPTLTLATKSESPLYINIDILSHSQLNYCLAPRVQDEPRDD